MKYLGQGIPPIWINQGEAKLSVCLCCHGTHKSTDSTSPLFCDVTVSLQIDLGLPSHPFQYLFTKLHLCVTNTHISILLFCNETEWVLKDDMEDWTKNSENGMFLMAEFMAEGFSYYKQLWLLNLCCKATKTRVLSDITTRDGKV